MGTLTGLLTGHEVRQLITLTGPGGSGKTRLAVEWSHVATVAADLALPLPGFVPLAAVTDARSLTGVVAAAVVF